MKVKGIELVKINKVLHELKSKEFNFKFSYVINKNINIIRPFVNKINDEKFKFSPDFLIFENERIDLVKKYSKKDEGGNPEIEGNNYVIDEDLMKEFEDEFKKLRETHKDTLKQEDERNSKIFNEELDVDFYAISVDSIGSGSITPKDLEVLFDKIIIE